MLHDDGVAVVSGESGIDDHPVGDAGDDAVLHGKDVDAIMLAGGVEHLYHGAKGWRI